jgi:hypothetical protein
VAQAANTTVLAAIAEINQRIFKARGDLTPTSSFWANAQMYTFIPAAYFRFELDLRLTIPLIGWIIKIYPLWGDRG